MWFNMVVFYTATVGSGASSYHVGVLRYYDGEILHLTFPFAFTCINALVCVMGYNICKLVQTCLVWARATYAFIIAMEICCNQLLGPHHQTQYYGTNTNSKWASNNDSSSHLDSLIYEFQAAFVGGSAVEASSEIRKAFWWPSERVLSKPCLCIMIGRTRWSFPHPVWTTWSTY